MNKDDKRNGVEGKRGYVRSVKSGSQSGLGLQDYFFGSLGLQNICFRDPGKNGRGSRQWNDRVWDLKQKCQGSGAPGNPHPSCFPLFYGIMINNFISF